MLLDNINNMSNILFDLVTFLCYQNKKYDNVHICT